jgi:starch phosphorylase
MAAFIRRTLRSQLERRGAPRTEIEAADEVLDPEALTIGFARRFATYKRASLLLRDPDRLARILNDPNRPAQIIFAGKAHPKDDAGKELIRQIVRLARQEAFRRRLVFIEDYDMAVARSLVQGVDVWLNTPRRPREASGTSGMKAAANGVLNLSVLDGWWDEVWRETDSKSVLIGWAIGRGEAYDTQDHQDEVEAETLYDLLERDVVPTFYDRGVDRLPRRWIARMKASISTLCHFVNTHRMVRQYTEEFYMPAASRYGQITAEGMARAKALAVWRSRAEQNWSQVRVEEVAAESSAELAVGTEVRVRARINLGALAPEDVAVELYVGQLSAAGEIIKEKVERMQPAGTGEKKTYTFQAAVPCTKSGQHGYTVRVLPQHPDLATPFLPGLIVWASQKTG